MACPTHTPAQRSALKQLHCRPVSMRLSEVTPHESADQPLTYGITCHKTMLWAHQRLHAGLSLLGQEVEAAGAVAGRSPDRSHLGVWVMASRSQEDAGEPRGHRPQDPRKLCEQRGQASEARTRRPRRHEQMDACRQVALSGAPRLGDAGGRLGPSSLQPVCAAALCLCPGQPCPLGPEGHARGLHSLFASLYATVCSGTLWGVLGVERRT